MSKLQFANPEQKPGDQWRGTDAGVPGNKLVGEDEQTLLTHEDVVSAWKQIFPNSSVGVSKAFGSGYTFKFRLAKDKTEVSNGILDNDPLYYTALLDKDLFAEYTGSLLVKPPEGSHMAFGSEKLRKKTIKGVTLSKLLARFQQVHDFVAANADRLKNPQFDINEKLGLGDVAESDRFLGEPYIREEDDDNVGNMNPDSYYSDDDIRNPNFKEEIYSGCYVRDEQNDGGNGEIFIMSGDPSERRVRIEDNDGRGWYVSPSQLTKVDDDDPKISRYFPGNGGGDEDEFLEEAKPASLISKIKAVSPGDQTSRDKEGNFIFRKGYYYRMGADSEQFAARVKDTLETAGLNVEIIGHGDHFASFKGGAGVKANSHFWVKARVTDAVSAPAVQETMYAGDFLNPNWGTCKAKDGGWYVRRLNRSPLCVAGPFDSKVEAERDLIQDGTKSGIDDYDIVQYSAAEHDFVKEANNESVEDIAESLKAQFEDYVKNKSEPADKKEQVTITYKDGHTQTKSVTEKEKKNYEISSHVKKVELAKNSKGRIDDTKLDEGISAQSVVNAIAHRISRQYPELIEQYGSEQLFDAIQEVAVGHAGAEELGSSDISGMVKQVIADLKSYSGITESDYSNEAFYTDDFLRQLMKSTYSSEGIYKKRIKAELAKRVAKRAAERTKKTNKDIIESTHATGARSLLLKKLADLKRTNPAKVKELQDKFQDVSQKLSSIREKMPNKVEEDFPTSLAPAGTDSSAATSTTASKPPQAPTPIAAQPKTTAQQQPVPAGTPTAAPGAGQPTPPAAGQAGGAPVTTNPGAPQPPTGGQVNAATTPIEQMKGFISTIAANPGAAKQLATKINTTLR